MAILYPQSPDDSHAYLAERNQPVANMAQMRQTIERQAARIKSLESDVNRLGILLDMEGENLRRFLDNINKLEAEGDIYRHALATIATNRFEPALIEEICAAVNITPDDAYELKPGQSYADLGVHPDVIEMGRKV